MSVLVNSFLNIQNMWNICFLGHFLGFGAVILSVSGPRYQCSGRIIENQLGKNMEWALGLCKGHFRFSLGV